MATAIEQVRLLIGDTGSVQFTDAEIQIFLDLASNSILPAASYALESWAATLTESYTSEKIGDYAYTKKAAENKITLAKKYREENDSSPAFEWSEIDLTSGSGITAEED